MAPYDKLNHFDLVVTDLSIRIQPLQRSIEAHIITCTPYYDDCYYDDDDDDDGDHEKGNSAKTTQSPKRRVQFADRTYIHEIPNKSDFTPEEKASVWLTYADWQRITEDRQCLIRSAIFGNVNEDDYLRGLENLLPKSSIRRKQNIRLVRGAVLREQSRAMLDNNGRLNDEYIAYMYANATKKSRDAAYQQGLEDQLETDETDEETKRWVF